LVINFAVYLTLVFVFQVSGRQPCKPDRQDFPTANSTSWRSWFSVGFTRLGSFRDSQVNFDLRLKLNLGRGLFPLRKSLVNLGKSPDDLHKTEVNSLKSPVNSRKSPDNLRKTGVNSLKSPINSRKSNYFFGKVHLLFRKLRLIQEKVWLI
jgi:hypothetical protein